MKRRLLISIVLVSMSYDSYAESPTPIGKEVDAPLVHMPFTVEFLKDQLNKGAYRTRALKQGRYEYIFKMSV